MKLYLIYTDTHKHIYVHIYTKRITHRKSFLTLFVNIARNSNGLQTFPGTPANHYKVQLFPCLFFLFFSYFDSFCRILIRYFRSLLTACEPVFPFFFFCLVIWTSTQCRVLWLLSDQVRMSKLQQEW